MPTDTAQIQGVRDYLHGVDATLEKLQKVLASLSLPELEVPGNGDLPATRVGSFKRPDVQRRANKMSRHASSIYFRNLPVAERKMKMEYLTLMQGLPPRTRSAIRVIRLKRGYVAAVRAAKRAHK